MKKFTGVEDAFQKIKAATGVCDANDIVNKFLNKENTYTSLLISISDYERDINELLKKNKKLKVKYKKLSQDNEPLITELTKA